MSKVTEVRLTLAAFIYGIEIDLKTVIKKFIVPFHEDLSFFHDTEISKRVIERFQKENIGVDYSKSIEDIIDYLDFGDTFIILKKNKLYLTKEAVDYIDSIFNGLISIIPIRNRVMHTRPLLGGDFSTVYDFIYKLSINDGIDWRVTIETRTLIEKDPTYVLTLKIPSHTYDTGDSKVLHNLPTPDFDETGFIGRVKDVDDIRQLVLSNRVVTILGDGGIGKTAVALKVAYDIVDLNQKSPFDLIIWTTAKTTMLTTKGIESIYTAITDYTGLINEISSNLDDKVETNKLDSIFEYLELFKTLIIIDNLETIQNEEVRNFIRIAQVKCHILITSRIGLGELEFPRKLSGMSESEATKLIREIARIRNSETLLRLPSATLKEISEKLYYNPLALKWFVTSVESGISPAEVLNNKDNLLAFCLTNVYGKLSSGAISILKTIRASRRKLTIGEIIYLSDMLPIEVRQYLIELFKTTLVNREIKYINNVEEVLYFLSDFSRDFLTKNYQIEPEYVKNITRKLKNLEEELRKISLHVNHSEFSINSLSFETNNQRIAAKFLSEALGYSRSGDFSTALQKVSEAKNIDSNYYEVYRVSAFIKATQGDILSAEEDYQTGLEISPQNLRLLFYYSQFLLFNLEDAEKALEYAGLLYSLKPDHPFSALLLARCYNSQGEYERAIEIVKKLLLDKNLDAKSKTIAYTELLNLYTNFGNKEFKVTKDDAKAISQFTKAFIAFEDAFNLNNFDIKLIKIFVESLSAFISLLPVYEIEHYKPLVSHLLEKYEKNISLTYLCHRMILKYSDKFHDDSFNHLLNYSIGNNKIIGKVNIVKDSVNYVFIESENGRYYANRNDFVDFYDLIEWKNIKEGQIVSFEKGQNHQGECAINIKII